MKKLIAPIATLALIFTVGCKTTGNNPDLGPALLRFTVGTAAAYELLENTNAVAGVKLGKELICAIANETNLSPVYVVERVNAIKTLSREEVFILRAAVGAYTLIYNGYADPSTNATALRPYLMATCLGLGDALPLDAATRDRAPKAVSSPQWVAPQVRFRK